MDRKLASRTLETVKSTIQGKNVAKWAKGTWLNSISWKWYKRKGTKWDKISLSFNWVLHVFLLIGNPGYFSSKC